MLQSDDQQQDTEQEEEQDQEQEGEPVQVEEPAEDAVDTQGPQWTKVVLIEGASGTTVGVQDADRHPVFTPLGDVRLEDAIGQVPGLLRDARERWRESPKYEPYRRPAPAPSQRPPRRAAITPVAAAATPEQDPQQRLF